MIKARLVMMSHLSDCQEMAAGVLQADKLNFVKYLLLKFPNTDVEIDADEEYNKFKERK